MLVKNGVLNMLFYAINAQLCFFLHQYTKIWALLIIDRKRIFCLWAHYAVSNISNKKQQNQKLQNGGAYSGENTVYTFCVTTN